MTTTSRINSSLGDHDARMDAKRERLEERASKKRVESDSRYKAAKDEASGIPFGQPILVGHHSEKRHRRAADRIHNNYGKSFELSKQADNLEARAERVGSSGIASDDANAIAKVEKKLSELKRSQELMKAVNKIVRAKKLSDEEKIQKIAKDHNISPKNAAELLRPDFAGRTGFASYALSNNNANIKRYQKRLEDLKQLHQAESLSGKGMVEGMAWELYEEDGRIKFSFDDKPSDEVRKLIKSYGFKWSRYSSAWVRKITSNAVVSANRLGKALNEF
ncbi:DUF3560 domain-containing protein [Vibrio mediterranei]|uniref:DUF3560 domain-containing protein n=1 Tax=Vibrio mediterranei TaxID=689 RepID=UPI001EFC86C4|nr:DUF3560 domain-containing protein [Vibrio mediterranei]MCG9661159.1 DUF3560 domain-containing protein [Vibrio mediterranei]